MRLIDADLLIEWIDAGHLRNPNELCFSEADVVEMIDHMPTIEERKTGTPCDLCRHNPPSSGDGKPCSYCPAEQI